MASLSLARSTHAPAYAKALSEVALAATTLGEEHPRVIGNATTAAAAQLGDVQPRAGLPAATPRSGPADPITSWRRCSTSSARCRRS